MRLGLGLSGLFRLCWRHFDVLGCSVADVVEELCLSGDVLSLFPYRGDRLGSRTTLLTCWTFDVVDAILQPESLS